jgi:hypothetical protein
MGAGVSIGCAEATVRCEPAGNVVFRSPIPGAGPFTCFGGDTTIDCDMSWSTPASRSPEREGLVVLHYGELPEQDRRDWGGGDDPMRPPRDDESAMLPCANASGSVHQGDGS